MSKLQKMYVHVTLVAMAQSYSDNALRYVLPDLWMTSCFHTMVQIRIQHGKLFTINGQVKLVNCTPGAKYAIVDCLVNVLPHTFPLML